MLYVATTDARAALRTYGAFVRERDQGGHLTVGTGIPAGPDPVDEPADDAAGGDQAAGPRTPDGEAADDVVQAVADFVDDLVLDDPAGDQVDGAAGHRSGDVTG